MADITKIQIESGTYDIKDNFSRTFTESYINVLNYGIDNTGVVDNASAIQELIDNNPHRTLYFPDGNYLIRESINIKSGNEYQVNLKFDNNARLFTNIALDSLINIGSIIEGTWDRYTIGNIVTIEGGIFDGTNTNKAIYLTADRKQTRLINNNIINVKKYGIYIDKNLGNTSTSSDALISNCSITGTGDYSDNNTGIFLRGFDNELNEIRITKINTGINVSSSGNIIDNVHLTEAYNENLATYYNNSIGFEFNGYGEDLLSNIYIDTFGKGMVFNTNKTTQITNMYTYYWFNTSESETNLFTLNSPTRIKVVNGDFGMTSNGTNRVINMDNITNVNYKNQYTAHDDLIFVNINVDRNKLQYDNDPINSMQVQHKQDQVVQRYPWNVQMTQNKYYPIALLKEGVYKFNVSMANDELIECIVKINSSGSSISVKNLYSSTVHQNEYKIAIANGELINSVYNAYLCIVSNSTNSRLNASITNVETRFDNNLFTHEEFNNDAPFESPSIITEASFNP